MPFIPVPNTVAVEMVFLQGGSVVQNVLHYEASGVPIPDEMVELANDIIAWWSSDVRPQVNDQTSLIEVRVTSLDDAIAPSVSVVTGLPLAGSAAQPMLPSNVTLSLTKRTILRGRNFRGRLYFIGLGEGQVVGNTVNGVTVTALINAYNNSLSFATTSLTWELVVVSLYFNNAPRTSGVTTEVTSFTSDGIIDSQRRRLPGRGI